MKYTDNSLNILTAKSYKGIGNAWIVKNLKGNESVETIVVLLNSKIVEKTTVAEFENLRNEFETKLGAKIRPQVVEISALEIIGYWWMVL